VRCVRDDRVLRADPASCGILARNSPEEITWQRESDYEHRFHCQCETSCDQSAKACKSDGARRVSAVAGISAPGEYLSHAPKQ
jgi:hypothetical protein